MGFDRGSGPIDHAPVADPPVAARDRPVVEPDSVARLVGLGGERIERELPARVVEQQVVGLVDVVDAGARGPRLDHVHGDVSSRPELLTSSGDHALQRADAPRSYSNDCDA